MKPIFISVVTIVRNGAEHIEQAMQSVLNQTYKNFEYIIIDGASTDGTVKLIEKHKDKLAKFISEADAGVSNAVNKSLPYIKGDFVAFLSCDNYLNPDALAVLVDGITDESKVVYGDFLFHDLKTSTAIPYKTSAKLLPQRMSICPEAMILKADVLRECGGYNEQKVVSADHYLFLKIYRNYGEKSFKHVNQEILNFRSGGLADKLTYQGYYENMQNKIELGYGKVAPRIEFIYLYIRFFIGRFLKRIGLFNFFKSFS